MTTENTVHPVVHHEPGSPVSESRHVDITGLTKNFIGKDKRSVPVIDQLDLYAKKEELVSIIGPSGCGKSTLFNILAGLDDIDEGQVLINGDALQRTQREVAYMPQKDMLFPWRTVLKNICLPLEIIGMPKREAETKAIELLPQFGLEQFADAYPFTLSGGMRQRAALLRTIIQDRGIILLDEPFGALDSLTRAAMQEFLLSIWSQFKRTVLFITHDIREAVYLSDRVYVLGPRPTNVLLEVPIDLPRPRTLEMTVSPEFAAIEARLLEALQSTFHLPGLPANTTTGGSRP